jgi:hypothetical protein
MDGPGGRRASDSASKTVEITVEPSIPVHRLRQKVKGVIEFLEDRFG